MHSHLRWTGWDGQGLEHCDIRLSAGALTLDGVVAGNRDGRYGAHYLVRTDEDGATRELRVAYAGGAEIRLRAPQPGRWHDDLRDRTLPDLDGCLDVDIGVTPSTNALPIRRLRLASGQAAPIRVAYVPLPSQISGDFLPRPAEQRYTRLGPDLYRYEGLFRNFTAELQVDDLGMVLDYPGYFRRLPGGGEG